MSATASEGGVTAKRSFYEVLQNFQITPDYKFL
jgi:hypothetical protein